MQSNGFNAADNFMSVSTPVNNLSVNMPHLSMDTPAQQLQMPSGGMEANNTSGVQKVLVELRLETRPGIRTTSTSVSQMNLNGFQLDTSYEPVSITPTAQAPGIGLTSLNANEETVIVRGVIEASRIPELEAQSHVVKVYKDTPISAFNPALLEKQPEAVVTKDTQSTKCPTGDCDCGPTTAKGTILDVAKYLGVDQIWSAGFKGQGIVVGVVDGGITAEGRPVLPGEGLRRIPNVIGGHLDDWGTKARSWGEHGNMCATDVLGMAPEAKLYDFRLAGGDAISNALAVFDWAIKQYQIDGTPQILTNSWGIYQKSWDDFYATNPEHPFTRKVVEAINLGIIVLFAAGNCGSSCPADRCGGDAGPGKSIWGANGHPLVMTVGAANREEKFVGYSSQGPAALDPNKPDFCSITHFRGYFGSDNGTSAACPIAAGVVALLKCAKPSLTQAEAKEILKKTAKDIVDPGFDQHSGAGIIQAKAAFDMLVPQQAKWSEWVSLGGNCFLSPAVAAAANRLDTFVISGDSDVYQKSWNGEAWSDWDCLGGFSLAAPAAISRGNNTDLFIIGQSRQLMQKSWDGKSWSEWINLGGFCKQGVAVCSSAENRLDLFTVGSDNAAYHKFWDGKTWSEWNNLGGFCLSAPTAVSPEANRIEVFVRGGDHSIYRKSWDGSAWTSKWESLGGLWLYSPAVASSNAKRLDVFAVGTDNAMYRSYWDGSTWSAWENLGGTLTSGLAAIAIATNRLETFAVGGDNALYRKFYG